MVASTLSVESFGEKTRLPITVADSRVSSWSNLPLLNKSRVELEIKLRNEAVCRNVPASLKLRLPMNASVKRFEMMRAGIWYPATAAPKKAAKAVVYKEKEKGRAVAALSNTESSSNVFEIEVSPLPFQQNIPCRVEILTDKDGLLELSSAFLNKTTGGRQSETKTHDSHIGKEVEVQPMQRAGAVVGRAFGKTHFACKVAFNSTTEPEPRSLNRVVVFWDCSASARPTEQAKLLRFSRLQELFACAETQTVELWVFSMGRPKKVGVYHRKKGFYLFYRDLHVITYDGGTDITVLPRALLKIGCRKKFDAAIVFTDGMDNLGRSPNFVDGGFESIPFPVHCVADLDEVNMDCLRHLAAASGVFSGSILNKQHSSYLEEILFERPFLESISVDQVDDAFLGEIDDGFCCVPDHRLSKVRKPVSSEGTIIVGTLGASVSRLTATVVQGRKTQNFHFHLREENDDESRENGAESDCDELDEQLHLAASFLPTRLAPDGSSSESPAARILGHLYAEAQYNAAREFEEKSGLPTKGVREELAVTYGFCSPESTLLMLYDAEQFLDYGLVPLFDHPAANHIPNAAKKQAPHTSMETYPQGVIGGIKTSWQRAGVVNLAERMNRFFGPPRTLPSPSTKDPSTLLAPKTVCSVLPASNTQPVELALEPGDSLRVQPPNVTFNDIGVSTTVPSQPPISAPLQEKRSSRQQDKTTRANIVEGSRHDSFIVEDTAESPLEIINLPGCPVPPSPKAAKRVSDLPAIEWLRCKTPSLDGIIDEPVPQTLSRVIGYPLPQTTLPFQSGEGVIEKSKLSNSRLGPSDAADFPQPRRSNSTLPQLFDEAKQNNPGRCVRLLGSNRTQEKKAPHAPKDPKLYLDQIERSLRKGDDRQWKRRYNTELNAYGGHGNASPSLFLNTARVLIKYGKRTEAIRIAGNCLEAGLDDVQLLRSVGYAMLATESAYGLDLAVQIFDKVKELSSLEPQSYLDSSLTRYWRSWKRIEVPKTLKSNAFHVLASDLIQCQKDVVHILTHCWAQRFQEVEWPALALLHYIAESMEDINSKTSTENKLPEWPEELQDFLPESEFGRKGSLRCQNKFDPALMVWLGWDTDKTDLDLHVQEPSGQKVYFRHKHGTGSILSKDFRQGYGPEVYLAKRGVAHSGTYRVSAQYYGSHQDSPLTGSTSAVLWTIETTGDGKKHINFDFVRMRKKGKKEYITTATVPVGPKREAGE